MKYRGMLAIIVAYVPVVACKGLADVGSFTHGSADASDESMATEHAPSEPDAGAGEEAHVPQGAIPEAGVLPDAVTPEAGLLPDSATPEAGGLSDAALCEASASAFSSLSAACAEAQTSVASYSSPAELASLVVGEWFRCEGPIQPAGEPVAPDGQNGLYFDLFAGQNQGSISGLIPDGPPCYGFGGVLVYVGNDAYGLVDWAFSQDDAGNPGIVFQGTRIGVIYDQPVFSNQGHRMVLSDPTWAGTYVRIPHS
jgi:hypothetical protein